jgi:hypothetical protein
VRTFDFPDAEQASAVQNSVTAYAEETGADRYEVEMVLKKAVRHPETAG